MVEGSPEQREMDSGFRKLVEERLNNDPELIKRFIPTFTVGCRRLTPGDGYLEALQQDNTKTIWSPIIKVTEKGILTEEGEEEFDMIVCATGFDVSFRPSWNLVGRNGVKLADKWHGEAISSYFGMCAVDQPNYFIYAGPNSPTAHGVLLGSMDAMTTYILKWCRKMATQGIK